MVLQDRGISLEWSFEERTPGRRVSKRIWSPPLPVRTGYGTQTKTGNASEKKLEQLQEKGICESSGL